MKILIPILDTHECQIVNQHTAFHVYKFANMVWVLLFDRVPMPPIAIDFCPYCGHNLHDDGKAKAITIAEKLSKKSLLQDSD